MRTSSRSNLMLVWDNGAYLTLECHPLILIVSHPLLELCRSERTTVKGFGSWRGREVEGEGGRREREVEGEGGRRTRCLNK